MLNSVCSHHVFDLSRKILSCNQITCLFTGYFTQFQDPSARFLSLLHAMKSYKLQFSKLENYSGLHVPCVTYSVDKNVRKMEKLVDPDKFGELTKDFLVEAIHDEGDVEEEKYVTYPMPGRQKLRVSQYADIIKQHLQNMEVLAAVDVLETRMIKEDFVKPDAYIFSLVIGACGRFGHTRKAFQLYNEMKKRALRIPGAVYTALFNACANAPSPEDGLQRTLKLQNLLVEKGEELNATHYHAMIKAFGRCGDLTRAFQVVDIMIDKKIKMNEETFNFLLQACITNKDDGFRYALLVWYKMLVRNVKPSVYSFNLLLRSVRDCNIGECENVEKIVHLLTLDKEHEMSSTIHENHSTNNLDMVTGDETQLETNPFQESVTNSLDSVSDLLSPKSSRTCDIPSFDLRKPHGRLFLLGGSSQFLWKMEKYAVIPNIKTYTLLLDCIPPTLCAEQRLLSKMKKDRINIDTEFCNMLIRKRSFRFDYKSAQDVLNLIKAEKLLPDIVTFGVLALACTNEEEAEQLVCNMRLAGYRINEPIVGAMLKQGCIRHNFKYITKILYLAVHENIKLSSKIMEDINNVIASSREILKKWKQGEIPKSLQNKTFKKEFTTFMYKYRTLVKEMAEKEHK